VQPFIERIQRYPVMVTAPGAGQEISISIGGSNLSQPGLGAWRIISIAYTLLTDANVANRATQWVMDDTGVPYFRASVANSQAANLTEAYGGFEGSTGGGANAAVNHIAWPSPGPVLYPGHRLRTITASLQPGDTYSNIALLVVEFPSGRYVQTQPGELAQVEEW